MSREVSKTPLVLLGLLTVLTLAGPLAIKLTLAGGRRAGWPPDRPREWWTFGLVVGSFLILMTACLALGLSGWRRTRARSEPPAPPRPGVDDSFNPD